MRQLLTAKVLQLNLVHCTLAVSTKGNDDCSCPSLSLLDQSTCMFIVMKTLTVEWTEGKPRYQDAAVHR